MYCHQIKIGGKYDLIKLYRHIISQNDGNPLKNGLKSHHQQFLLQGYYKFFRHRKCAICGWLVYVKKKALYIKFLLVSYPHFLNISFNLTKCGLSYGFKHDPRPFSEFTQVWTILSLTASKMDFGGCHCIDRLEIQLGTISLFNQLWISSLSMAASKIHYWRLSMIRWSKLV